METPGPQQVIDSFKSALGSAVVASRVYQREIAVKRNTYTSVWLDVTRDGFHDAVAHIFQLQDHPHFTVVSPVDRGDTVELLYHFSLFYGRHLQAIALVIRVTLPKTDLTIPTITDLIPGSIFSEREVQEMMGVKVAGIADDRRSVHP